MNVPPKAEKKPEVRPALGAPARRFELKMPALPAKGTKAKMGSVVAEDQTRQRGLTQMRTEAKIRTKDLQKQAQQQKEHLWDPALFARIAALENQGTATVGKSYTARSIPPSLLQKIEELCRRSRGNLSLSLDSPAFSRVDIEAQGPKSVALRIRGRRPLTPHEVRALRQQMAERGISLSSLAVETL